MILDHPSHPSSVTSYSAKLFLCPGPFQSFLFTWLQHRSYPGCKPRHSCQSEPLRTLSSPPGMLGRGCKRSPPQLPSLHQVCDNRVQRSKLSNACVQGSGVCSTHAGVRSRWHKEDQGCASTESRGHKFITHIVQGSGVCNSHSAGVYNAQGAEILIK